MRLLVALLLAGCATAGAIPPSEVLCAGSCPGGYTYAETYGVDASAGVEGLSSVSASAGLARKAKCACSKVAP